MKDKRMEMLADIMFEEDTYRYNDGRELIYHTKEEYEEEREERYCDRR